MGDGNRSGFSLEEILEEQRRKRDTAQISEREIKQKTEQNAPRRVEQNAAQNVEKSEKHGDVRPKKEGAPPRKKAPKSGGGKPPSAKPADRPIDKPSANKPKMPQSEMPKKIASPTAPVAVPSDTPTNKNRAERPARKKPAAGTETRSINRPKGGSSPSDISLAESQAKSTAMPVVPQAEKPLKKKKKPEKNIVKEQERFEETDRDFDFPKKKKFGFGRKKREDDLPENDFDMQDIPSAQEMRQEQEKPVKKKKEKKKGGWFGFGKKNKKPDFVDSEEMYYGIQLKPIDEYREGYDPATGEFSLNEEGYAALFKDSKKTIDTEVEENFKKLKKERRARISEVVETVGKNRDDIEDIGVIAPMPAVSNQRQKSSDTQKAPANLYNTMEIKLSRMNADLESRGITGEIIGEKVVTGILGQMPDIASGLKEVSEKTEKEQTARVELSFTADMRDIQKKLLSTNNIPHVQNQETDADKSAKSGEKERNFITEKLVSVSQTLPEEEEYVEQRVADTQETSYVQNRETASVNFPKADRERKPVPEKLNSAPQGMPKRAEETQAAPKENIERNFAEKKEIKEPVIEHSIKFSVTEYEQIDESQRKKPKTKRSVFKEVPENPVPRREKRRKPIPNMESTSEFSTEEILNAPFEAEPVRERIVPEESAKEQTVSSEQTVEIQKATASVTVSTKKVPPENSEEEPDGSKYRTGAQKKPLKEEIRTGEREKTVDTKPVKAEPQEIISDAVPVKKNGKSARRKKGPPVQERMTADIPQVSSMFEYRARGIPMHVISAEALKDVVEETKELSIEAPTAEIPLRKSKAQEEQEEEKGLLKFVDKPISVLSKLPGMAMPAVQSIFSLFNKKGKKEEDKKVFEPIFSSGEPVTQESAEDYTTPGEEKEIATGLKTDMRDITLRMMITGACTFALFLVNVIFAGTFSSDLADLSSAPVVYIVLTLIFLCASIGVCHKTIWNGLKALANFNANSDSAIAIAAVGTIFQAISAIFYTEEIVKGNQHLYAVVFTGLLVVNAAGKLAMLRRIHSNFRFVSSKETKYAVKIYNDHNNALKMVGDSVAEKPVVAYQRKSGFLKRFIEISFEPDPAEVSSQITAPISLVASLVLCAIAMIVTGKVSSALGAFTASLIVTVASANMLAVNLPISRLAKQARRAGAMIPSYAAVQEFGNANAVIIDADDLFPTGTVVLNGIKSYTDRDTLETSVLAASALMDKIGGPLSGVFEQVISENEEVLPKVNRMMYEDERGIIGYVNGRKVHVGNRDLLIGSQIEPPPREDETQYTNANKQMLYIAIDNKIAAMLVVTYTADRRKKNEMQRLEENGVSVVVKTTDPNVTVQNIARLFGIDTNSVAILKEPMTQEYEGLIIGEEPRSDAVLATKGRIESMMSVISACIRARQNANFAVMLQNIAVALGFVFVAMLACFGSINSLSAFWLFLFELVMLLVLILLPKLRK